MAQDILEAGEFVETVQGTELRSPAWTGTGTDGRMRILLVIDFMIDVRFINGCLLGVSNKNKTKRTSNDNNED